MQHISTGLPRDNSPSQNSSGTLKWTFWNQHHLPCLNLCTHLIKACHYQNTNTHWKCLLDISVPTLLLPRIRMEPTNNFNCIRNVWLIIDHDIHQTTKHHIWTLCIFYICLICRTLLKTKLQAGCKWWTIFLSITNVESFKNLLNVVFLR